MVRPVHSASAAPPSKYCQALLDMDNAKIICLDSKSGALVSIRFQSEAAAENFLGLFGVKFENMFCERDQEIVHIQTNQDGVESEHIVDILKKSFGNKYIEDKITSRG